MSRKELSTIRRQAGQGMTEFALVLPILLLLVLGVIEVGRLMFIYVAVTTTSREAARYGAAVGEENPGDDPFYADCAGIREAASGLGNLVGIQPTQIVIEYDRGLTGGAPTPAPFDDCPVGGTGPDEIELGDRITVHVSANYQPLVPIVPLPAFPINSVTSRTILEDVPIGTAAVLPTHTATATPVLPPMWIESIVLSVNPISNNKYQAQAVVRFVDSVGGVSNAQVEGDFSGNSSSREIRSTDINGYVTFLSPTVNNNWSSWTFCVLDAEDVTFHWYNPALNVEGPCKTINFATATPTLTPTPTSTPSWTPTPTHTSTPSQTPTQTLTPSPTLTHTPGPSPTPSSTPTSTPTPTLTPTPTPTPLPTPSCAISASNFLVSTNNVYVTINNNTAAPREITAITIQDWPQNPANQQVRRVLFNSNLIWSGSSSTPPTTINSDWIGSAALRQVPNGSSYVLNIMFEEDLQAGPIVLQVTFDNGCIVSANRP
ncbi:MAG TPA: TadE/TadG family type IV pilus assembly protein [Anaerolineales bacterium]|nr:TadE/TadG family type IV pilus assembly protein [Anaerolineales bacterium]